MVDEGHPGDVICPALSAFGNFDFEGAYAGEVLLDEAPDGVLLGDGVECRNSAVDGDVSADGSRWAIPRHFEAVGQPVRGLFIVVFGECSELSPSRGAGEEHHFAVVDAPEGHSHGQTDHHCPLVQFGERRPGCAGGGCVGLGRFVGRCTGGHSSTLLAAASPLARLGRVFCGLRGGTVEVQRSGKTVQ